ncbi:hypothetical protein AB1Y20_009956 [Prymnesium parvum]|uniref:Uncharacterized protein n=1 Tax=Prymnesium parvum TaxID=97485 RepID=A0AB34K2C2_PRYPA
MWEKELGHAIAVRVTQRLGENVYQMFSMTLPSIPKAVLEAILPQEHVVESTSTAISQLDAAHQRVGRSRAGLVFEH